MSWLPRLERIRGGYSLSTPPIAISLWIQRQQPGAFLSGDPVIDLRRRDDPDRYTLRFRVDRSRPPHSPADSTF